MRVGLGIAAGLVIQFLVAWTFAILLPKPPRTSSSQRIVPQPASPPDAAPPRVPAESVSIVRMRGMGYVAVEVRATLSSGYPFVNPRPLRSPPLSLDAVSAPWSLREEVPGLFDAREWPLVDLTLNEPEHSRNRIESRGFSYFFLRPLFHREAWGWPWPSMGTRLIRDPNGLKPQGVTTGTFRVRWPIWQSTFGVDPTTIGIPATPIWPNVLANTAFYAAIIIPLLIFSPIRRARAADRTRKGLCPRCAYDLKHDRAAGCSECGWNRAARSPSDPATPLTPS